MSQSSEDGGSNRARSSGGEGEWPRCMREVGRAGWWVEVRVGRKGGSSQLAKLGDVRNERNTPAVKAQIVSHKRGKDDAQDNNQDRSTDDKLEVEDRGEMQRRDGCSEGHRDPRRREGEGKGGMAVGLSRGRSAETRPPHREHQPNSPPHHQRPPPSPHRCPSQQSHQQTSVIPKIPDSTDPKRKRTSSHPTALIPTSRRSLRQRWEEQR